MKITFLKYLILSIALIVLTEITNNILDFKGLLYNSLAEKLTNKQIQHFFEFQDKWQWLRFVFIPIILLIKTSLIASTLYIGTFFFSKVPVTFKQLWGFVVKAEFVFLLVPVFKIAWFYFFQTNYKLEDIQYFYPLSALNIVGYKDLEPWFIYPFQTLNLFELAYWLILAYYIGKATKTTMDQGLKIVAYSYGSTLLLWVVTIMFFTLNYS
ncbi:hypothetical protein [Flavobacterium sp. UBA6046]|uniref:hypothetical protein n=1 Tax=Flavobacterium sp. UBA6046 TaxID=1946552 RepID=UPI0025BB6546|nr:hypothetical protein [Flavobacterium sp. UBA6046]